MKEVKLEALPKESTASRFLRAFKTLAERIGFSKKIDRTAERLGQGKVSPNISEARREAVKRQLPVLQAQNKLEEDGHKKDLLKLAEKATKEIGEFERRTTTINEEIQSADRIIDRLTEKRGSISEKLAESRIRLEQRKKELDEWKKTREQIIDVLPEDVFSIEDDVLENKEVAEEPFEISVFRNVRNFSEFTQSMLLLPKGRVQDKFGGSFSAEDIGREISDLRTILRKKYNTQVFDFTVDELESFQIQALPENLQQHVIRLFNKEMGLYKKLSKVPAESLVFAFNVRNKQINSDMFEHYATIPGKQSISLMDFETATRAKYAKEGHGDKFEKEWNDFLDRLMAGYHG